MNCFGDCNHHGMEEARKYPPLYPASDSGNFSRPGLLKFRNLELPPDHPAKQVIVDGMLKFMNFNHIFLMFC